MRIILCFTALLLASAALAQDFPIVARSSPDGYTWLLTTDNILTVNPHLGQTPFDPFNDFTPVTQHARILLLERDKRGS